MTEELVFKEMDVHELKEKLENQSEDFILIDVREHDEWECGHIPNAIFMPLSRFEQEVKNTILDPSKELILQCRSGKRSQTACKILAQHGRKKLFNLTGGILAWQDAGFTIEN